MNTATQPTTPDLDRTALNFDGISRRSYRELVAFTTIVFAALWVPAGILIFAPDLSNALFTRAFGRAVTPIHLVILGAYSPTLASLILTAVYRRKAGLRDLFRRLFHWQVSVKWWLIAFLTYPAAFLVSYLIRAHVLGGAPVEYSLFFHTLPILLATGFILQDSGALGEELGLRGYALPRLLQQWSPFGASLILGFVWSIWHLPAFFLVGVADHANWSFWLFLLVPVGISFFMTYLYINTRGSILLSGIIPHMMVNATGESGIEPDITVLMVVVLLTVGAISVWLGRRQFFHRSREYVYLENP